jgi:hypothetical protein
MQEKAGLFLCRSIPNYAGQSGRIIGIRRTWSFFAWGIAFSSAFHCAVVQSDGNPYKIVLFFMLRLFKLSMKDFSDRPILLKRRFHVLL